LEQAKGFIAINHIHIDSYKKKTIRTLEHVTISEFLQINHC